MVGIFLFFYVNFETGKRLISDRFFQDLRNQTLSELKIKMNFQKIQNKTLKVYEYFYFECQIFRCYRNVFKIIRWSQFLDVVFQQLSSFDFTLLIIKYLYFLLYEMSASIRPIVLKLYPQNVYIYIFWRVNFDWSRWKKMSLFFSILQNRTHNLEISWIFHYVVCDNWKFAI